jgi:hypothetical protein
MKRLNSAKQAAVNLISGTLVKLNIIQRNKAPWSWEYDSFVHDNNKPTDRKTKTYKVVIEFEVVQGLTTDELESVADAMAIQYESIKDGDICNKHVVLTNLKYEEIDPYST